MFLNPFNTEEAEPLRERRMWQTALQRQAGVRSKQPRAHQRFV